MGWATMNFKDLLRRALQLSGSEREAFLKEACGDDHSLYEELLDEIASEEQMTKAPYHEGQSEQPELAQRRIGVYRIVSKLGQGGMGVVYKAVRDDGELDMTVAIKLIKAGSKAPEFLARFRRECQLLFDLGHAHIAKFLDAGRTEEGEPYLIMKYVEGSPINRYCRDHKLGLVQHLRLFRKLLEAVAMAHRKGVIHRDIKPNNVLVNQDGDPVLLDFGIAHSVEDGQEQNGLTVGHIGPMTPAYAAPEQKRGEPATPRFDIYALGLLLTEILLGRRPSNEASSLFATLQKNVMDGQEDWHKAMEDGQLPPSVTAFLRTALAEDPEKRYDTCEAMLLDLDHLLNMAENRGELPRLQQSLHCYDLQILVASEGRDAALPLSKAFEAQGMKVNVLSPGQDAAAMSAALQEAPICLTALTPKHQPPWSNSETCEALAQRVRTGQVRLIPFLLAGSSRPREESALPFYLRRQAWLSWSDGDAIKHIADHFLTRQSTLTSHSIEGTCPFRGLEAFREEDARFFFGREAITQRLEDHLGRHKFLAVLGPSGSGKSSLVQAGLLPDLHHAGRASLLFTPNQHPIRELAYALAPHFPAENQLPADQLLRRLRQDERSLHFILRELREIFGGPQSVSIVIDQFEEIFTLSKEEAEVRLFLKNLLYAIEGEGDAVKVILTMRSDFLGKCVNWPDLNAFICDHMIQVEPMDDYALTRAVVEPARLVGLEFEPGLADVIINDVKGAAGELPLLEHALLELYERRKGNQLTAAAYAEIGGIEGALARRAESCYSGLDKADQATLRKMFTLCLVTPGDGSEDTRRRASRREIRAVAPDPQSAEALLQKLIQARLLTAHRDEAQNKDQIDVAHEALIRKWDRIKTWMDEDRESIRQTIRLRRNAETWNEADRSNAYLLNGPRLMQIEELFEEHKAHLTQLERDFVRASRKNHRKATVLRRLLVSAAFLGVLGFALVIAYNNREIRRQKEATEEVSKFMSEIFVKADPLREEGPDLTAMKVIDVGAARLKQQLQSELHHGARIKLLMAFAETYNHFGEFQVAGDMAKELLTLQKAHGASLQERLESMVLLTTIYWETANYEEGLKLIEEALAICDASFKNTEHHYDCLNLKGLLLQDTGEFEQARSYHKRALDIGTRFVAEKSEAVAQSYNNLGTVAFYMEDYQEALSNFEKALELNRKAFGDENLETGRCYNNLGFINRRLGNLQQALVNYKMAVDIWTKTLGEEHPETATALNNLGILYRQLDELEKARPYLEKALDIRKKSLGEDHPQAIAGMRNLADLYAMLARAADGRPIIERALDISEQKYTEGNWRIYAAQSIYGLILVKLGEHDQGFRLLVTSYEGLVQVRGNDDMSITQEALKRLIRAHDAHGDAQEAARYRPFLVE